MTCLTASSLNSGANLCVLTSCFLCSRDRRGLSIAPGVVPFGSLQDAFLYAVVRPAVRSPADRAHTLISSVSDFTINWCLPSRMNQAHRGVLYRVFLVVLAAGTLVILWNLPHWANWDDEASTNWLAALQLAGPFAALVLGGFAASRSSGRDRLAWQLIAAGSLLYVVGNIAYIIMALSGDVVAFPTPPDLAFFAMALLFAAGIIIYSRRRSLPLVIRTYNFVLLYGAVLFGVRFLLHHEIKASQVERARHHCGVPLSGIMGERGRPGARSPGALPKRIPPLANRAPLPGCCG